MTEKAAGETLRLTLPRGNSHPVWHTVLPSKDAKQLVCLACGAWGELPEATPGRAVRAIIGEHTKTAHPAKEPSWLVSYRSRDMTENDT